MTTYRAIHGNNPPPEGQPVMVRCPKHGDLPEGYAVIRKRRVRLLMDATGEELTRPADLWTEAPVLPQCWGQAKPGVGTKSFFQSHYAGPECADVQGCCELIAEQIIPPKPNS